MKRPRWLQKWLCRIPFSPFRFYHDELRIVQRMSPTNSDIVQCQSCGRLFGMNHSVKQILPMDDDLVDMYTRFGNKLKHVESKHCWCHPYLEYKDPNNGNEVWVHNEIQDDFKCEE